jgi:hypothetical protein
MSVDGKKERKALRSAISKKCERTERAMFNVVYYFVADEESEELQGVWKMIVKLCVKSIMNSNHLQTKKQVARALRGSIVETLYYSGLSNKAELLSRIGSEKQELARVLDVFAQHIVELRILISQYPRPIVIYKSKRDTAFDPNMHKRHGGTTRADAVIDYVVFPGFKDKRHRLFRSFVVLK